MVELLGHTKTTTGLTVWGEWDQGECPTGITIMAQDIAVLNLEANRITRFLPKMTQQARENP